jgi:dipeptidyl aminopeptidase/acylaminoacyl peptidase
MDLYGADMTLVAPYGSWPSIVTAADVVAGDSTPTALHAAEGVVWWSETRPEESGREAIVRRDPDGSVHEVLPAGFNARTAVHEYGGGAWWVHRGTVFASSWADQRLYRIDPGCEPVPISPEPPTPRSWRYADGRVTPDGRWIICVRERHEGQDPEREVHNELVVLPVDGSAEPEVAFSGTDFVAAPRVSRDGRQLAWLAWDHPNMPWDSTQLWIGLLVESDGVLNLRGARREAGSGGESLVQPEWGRHATLYVCSDRSDWWNVHRVDGLDNLTPIDPVEAEVSGPAWTFGQSRYVVLPDGSVVAAHTEGLDTILTSIPEAGERHARRLEGLHVSAIAFDGDRLVGIVTFPDRPAEIRSLTDPEVLRPGSGVTLPGQWVSVPTKIRFPTVGGEHAYAWVHLPSNPDAQPEPGTVPPLLVGVHGGPTWRASAEYSLDVQFWTSRGFAVADVDYRGSTGYGRAFRQLLYGQWGVVDVEDAAAAARHLADEGLVDPRRMAIRGGSAGGLTTLLATMLDDAFAAGVSYFGVVDMAALIADTHKFESRYLDTMVGPMPEAAAAVRDRSPITHVDRAHTPTLVMQGLEDAVVPPAQAEAIVAALSERGVPHAYLPFAGEQHGFRMAATQIRALEAELSFYAEVFGFTPADRLEPLELKFAENLPNRST